ncbi:A1S_2505 family phage non-structural protein [Roseibium sp.]|uniref:A1S_2505 family phage non-structural protein n=2 Tax=Roseibium sp. TaxID=1936156 RepID=UPI003C7B38A3
MAIFVFGSNMAGRHGKGAALYAKKHFGAEQGVGEGPTGSAYAIPTKGKKLERLEWTEIEPALERFVQYARDNPNEVFHLTPVGTGLAGHSMEMLRDSLKRIGLPNNVLLTASWINDG